MPTIHRTLDGAWAECANQENCESVFHFENFTVSEAEAMPLRALLPILAVIQPSTHDTVKGGQAWTKALNSWYSRMHRDYDLPAVIEPDGTLVWYQEDARHRDRDRPAVIQQDGTQKWYQEGELHRDGFQPAVIRADGRVQYWIRGKRLTARDAKRLRSQA